MVLSALSLKVLPSTNSKPSTGTFVNFMELEKKSVLSNPSGVEQPGKFQPSQQDPSTSAPGVVQDAQENSQKRGPLPDMRMKFMVD